MEKQLIVRRITGGGTQMAGGGGVKGGRKVLGYGGREHVEGKGETRGDHFWWSAGERWREGTWQEEIGRCGKGRSMPPNWDRG